MGLIALGPAVDAVVVALLVTVEVEVVLRLLAVLLGRRNALGRRLLVLALAMGGGGMSSPRDWRKPEALP